MKASAFALEYQREFRKDIFVDMLCYRRHGHNELDDPTFTNPLLYKAIEMKRSIPDIYAEELVNEGKKRIANTNCFSLFLIAIFPHPFL